VPVWKNITTTDDLLAQIRSANPSAKVDCSKQLTATDISLLTDDTCRADDLLRALAFSAGWSLRKFADGTQFLAPAGGGYLKSVVTGRALAAQRQSGREAFKWAQFAVTTLSRYHGMNRLKEVPPLCAEDLLAGFRRAETLTEAQRAFVSKAVTEADATKHLGADVLRDGKIAPGVWVRFVVGSNLGIYRPSISDQSRVFILPVVPYAPTDDSDADTSLTSTNLAYNLSLVIKRERMQLHTWYEEVARQKEWCIVCAASSRSYIVDFGGLKDDLLASQIRVIQGGHPDLQLRLFGSVLAERNLAAPKAEELPETSGWAEVAADVKKLADLLDSLTEEQRRILYDHEMRLSRDQLTAAQRQMIDDLVRGASLSLVKQEGLKTYIDFQFAVELVDANGSEIEVKIARPFLCASSI
jgi:hypothetical protein